MKKIILAASIVVIAMNACTKAEKTRTERVFDINVNLENDFINIDNTKRQYNAHSGDYYSGVDSITVYGAGYVKKIDDTLRGYGLDICVSAWVREVAAPSEGAIAVSLNGKGGETKNWTGVRVKEADFKPNEWIHIVDTFRYQSEFMKDIEEIKIFSMKQAGKDSYDVDDLRIKYLFHK